MTEITDLSPTDSSNTAISGFSLDGSIANMSTVDNVFQAYAGLLARWDRSGNIAKPIDIRGHLYGLTLSNNVTDATNDIDIAAGSAVDSTGTVSMLLASSLTKRLDAAWAAGTNQGGLDVGSVTDENYSVFVIRRPDTGVVDALFSLSVNSPTLPANYTQFRRVGTIFRGFGVIRPFSQVGDVFLLKTPVLDVNAVNPGTSAVLRTLSVPAGIVTTALLNVGIENTAASDYFSVLLSSTDTDDVSVSIAGYSTLGASANVSGGARFLSSQAEVRTNTSRQIRSRAMYSDANCALYVSTRGWIDTRGA